MNTARPPETVRAYLDALQRALKGCSPGLISDALADAEEHLRSEIAAKPHQSEAQVLASVVQTYGTPDEIAEEYKSMEASISGPFPKSAQAPARTRGFFGVVGDPKAYGALMYMLLSLVTGIFYFCWTVVGGSISLSFLIFIIGIPLMLLFLGSIRVLSHVEGRIVEGLLGVRMPRRLPAASPADETLWSRIKDALSDIRTWSSMLYLLAMLPLGILYFTLAVVGIAIPLALIGGSLTSLLTGHAHFQMSDVPWLDHLFHTAPGLVLAIFVGLLFIFLVLHLAKAIGWLHGRIAELLLVRL
ncbi:MAG TPA: sensor domain-containing protein [Rhizomicrobium sp.]